MKPFALFILATVALGVGSESDAVDFRPEHPAASDAVSAADASCDEVGRKNRVSKWECQCTVYNGGTQTYEACSNSQSGAHMKANAKCEAQNSGWNACRCGDCHEIGYCD